MSQPRPELRVGDRERDLVVSALQDAMAEGRITLDELDERVDAALAARTFSDLDPLVADLPIEPPSTALSRFRPGLDARTDPPSGASAARQLVLDAGWSSVTRTGSWQVPPFLRVNGAAGSVKLDCLQATPLADVIDIEVIGGMGSIGIVVPESWGANLDGLNRSWGYARTKVSPVPLPGSPVLLLHGSLDWGWLTIRHANRFDVRRLEKQGVALPRPPELER